MTATCELSFTSSNTQYCAKLVYTSPDVNTQNGVKNLEIYYEPYGASAPAGKTEANYIADFTALAELFLKRGSNNDLYD